MIKRLTMRNLAAFLSLFASISYGATANTPETTVSLPGIGANGVKLTTDVSQFAFSYPLEATGDVKSLTVAVDDFHGPNNSVVTPEVTLAGQPARTAVDVGKSDRPVLRISGTFPYAGDYTSNIVITHDGS